VSVQFPQPTVFVSVKGINQLVFCNGKGKGAVHPRTVHEDPELEYRYNSTLSLTSALSGVGGQGHAPAALPLGNTRYPLYRRLGCPRAGLDGCRKSRLHRDSIPEPSSP
jgi:hypothetical protein